MAREQPLRQMVAPVAGARPPAAAFAGCQYFQADVLLRALKVRTCHACVCVRACVCGPTRPPAHPFTHPPICRPVLLVHLSTHLSPPNHPPTSQPACSSWTP